MWEFWTDTIWSEYSQVDQDCLEKAFASKASSFQTEELSFNADERTLYCFDFTAMTQVNTASGKSRKIRRTVMSWLRGVDFEGNWYYSGGKYQISRQGEFWRYEEHFNDGECGSGTRILRKLQLMPSACEFSKCPFSVQIHLLVRCTNSMT